jgi:hypothetical protein
MTLSRSRGETNVIFGAECPHQSRVDVKAVHECAFPVTQADTGIHVIGIMLRLPAVPAALSVTHRGNHRDRGVTWLTLLAGASITDSATRLQDFRRNAIVFNSSLCGLSRSKVAISRNSATLGGNGFCFMFKLRI